MCQKVGMHLQDRPDAIRAKNVKRKGAAKELPEAAEEQAEEPKAKKHRKLKGQTCKKASESAAGLEDSSAAQKRRARRGQQSGADVSAGWQRTESHFPSKEGAEDREGTDDDASIPASGSPHNEARPA
jgi:hypothetical protein